MYFAKNEILYKYKHTYLCRIEQNSYLGSRVGIHAMLAKAAVAKELILANSVTPPDLESGPTGSTFQRISSLQKPDCNPIGRDTQLQGLVESGGLFVPDIAAFLSGTL